MRFDRALQLDADYRYFLDESGAPPVLRSLPSERRPADRIAALIGPEGGWTDSERDSAIAAGWKAVGLGPQILRAETAAAAILALLSAAWQE